MLHVKVTLLNGNPELLTLLPYSRVKGLRTEAQRAFRKRYLTLFTAILEDGSVVSWGDATCSGDSSAVRDQLKGVLHIQATKRTFAAILADGSVVTWGDAGCGGDSSAVKNELRFVVQLCMPNGNA